MRVDSENLQGLVTLPPSTVAEVSFVSQPLRERATQIKWNPRPSFSWGPWRAL